MKTFTLLNLCGLLALALAHFDIRMGVPYPGQANKLISPVTICSSPRTEDNTLNSTRIIHACIVVALLAIPIVESDKPSSCASNAAPRCAYPSWLALPMYYTALREGRANDDESLLCIFSYLIHVFLLCSRKRISRP